MAWKLPALNPPHVSPGLCCSEQNGSDDWLGSHLSSQTLVELEGRSVNTETVLRLCLWLLAYAAD